MEVLDANDERTTEAVPVTPPVEIVVVAHHGGDWFEETLLSLGVQDYEALTARVILNLPAGSGRDSEINALTRLIDARLPGAVVQVIDPVAGFAAAANTVLAEDQLPAYYLFCHDDVALGSDTVTLLVEEALKTNAGVLGPKLVDWDNPEELRQVGMSIDKLGYRAPPVEVGELDQEQHDAVADIFAIPGGCQLVRADLFHALEGFDSRMTLTGEDIEYCWRVRLPAPGLLWCLVRWCDTASSLAGPMHPR